MTPTTLQALRRLLFFSQPEAAQLIGSVSERSWRFWEDGSRTIPADVIERIQLLIDWREQTLLSIKALIGHRTDAILVWYLSQEDWLSLPEREPLFWRPHCSVIAQLCAEGATALPFDAAIYAAWLGDRPDSEAMHIAWAASY